MKSSFQKFLLHAVTVVLTAGTLTVFAHNSTHMLQPANPMDIMLLHYLTGNPAMASGDSVVKYTLDNEKVSEYNFFIDALGDVYATSYTSYKAVKLINHKWVSVQENMAGNVSDLALADDGSIYASTTLGLYKRKKSSWTMLGEHKGEAKKVAIGNDGNLYAGREGKVIKWGAKGWEVVGESKMKAIAPSFNDYFLKGIDASGRIYVVGNFKNEVTEKYFVAFWTGTDWINIGDMAGKVYDLYVSDNNIVYVLGYEDGRQFFLQWDGTSWSPVALPPEINQLSDLQQNQLGQIFIRAKDPNPDIEKYRFYKLVNNQWEFLMEYPFKESGVTSIPVSDQLMYVFQPGNIVTEYRIIKNN